MSVDLFVCVIVKSWLTKRTESGCDGDGDGDGDFDGDGDGDGDLHDDDDKRRLHSGTMCFPEKIRTSMGIKGNNIFGLISQTFQFMAKYIFSAIHFKNTHFVLKYLEKCELCEIY